MSTKHGFDEGGAVICTASPRADGSNVTSSIDLVTCPDCRAELKWFINECGDVYDYWATRQERDFPGDFHTAYETKAEAEAVAARLSEVTPVPQMSYEDAISYAIFAVNTLIHPDGTGDEDFARLELHSDEVLTTLVDLRETVQGLTSSTAAEPRWPAVTPT